MASGRLNILLVGGGGREHALARRIAQSPLTAALFAAPGNPGIAAHATCVAIHADNVAALVEFAVANAIDLVIVGPEAPLVNGLADQLGRHGILVFGPNANAAILEGSKSFMKDIAAQYGIPTASYRRFRDPTDAKTFVRNCGVPIVIKADGLASGKGVTIARTIAEAEDAIDAALIGYRFGDAGREIVIEEFMAGEEVSYFAILDGNIVVPFGGAQDHKTVGDGDVGPNTGGMGAYSPAPILTPELEEKILARIVKPLAAAMVAEGRPYRGILFAGLMIAKNDYGQTEPKLIEINVRFGDPECQVLMARLKSDPVALMMATATGTLSSVPPPTWRTDTALAVVMCAKGYPGTPVTGSVIRGLADASSVEDCEICHAGTARGVDGALLSSGGRVLNIIATGGTAAEAQARAYRAVDLIEWLRFCRRDIGWRAIERETHP